MRGAVCKTCQYYQGVEQKFADAEHEQRRLVVPQGRPNQTGINWAEGTHAENMRKLRQLKREQRPESTRIRVFQNAGMTTAYRDLHRVLSKIYAKRKTLKQDQIDLIRYIKVNREKFSAMTFYERPEILEGWTRAGFLVCVKLPPRRSYSPPSSSASSDSYMTHKLRSKRSTRE